jgi:hypothetical protein
MPVPTARTDLSTTAASNSPAGSEAIGTNADDYIRAAFKFIRENYDDVLLRATIASPTFTGTVTTPALVTTGSATLGDTSADTHTLAGIVTFSGASASNYSINFNVAGNGNAWRSVDASIDSAYFHAAGAAHIGTISNHGFVIRTNNTAQLTFAAGGDAEFTGSVTSPDFVETSTRELKSEIVDVEAGAIDRIKALGVKEYKFDGSDRTRVGVIAEEVGQRYSVGGKAVSLTAIIFDLVQAVKELEALVAAK